MSDVAFDEDELYATLDEAIAAAFADAPDGEEIAVHSPNCEMGQWVDEESGETKPCTCTPAVHVVNRGEA